MSTDTQDDHITPEHSPEPGDAREQESEANTPSSKLRPLLLRSLLASLLVHLSPLLLLLHFEHNLSPVELDTEWFGEFEKLEAIGHGDNFAPQQVQLAINEEEEEDPKEVEPEPPAPEEEDEEEEEEVPEDKIEEPAPEKKVEHPEPEPPKEQKKTLVEEKRKDAVDPPPREEKKEKKTPPAVAAKQEPDEEKKPDEEPAKPRTGERDARSLPGLEYDGPSNLPMLKNYAPGNARMTALIRLDLLRDTPYHEHTNALLEAVPDYRIILAKSGTDAVRDFDAIFTASADPRYLQETFLVVKHSLGKKQIQQRLDDRFADPSPWTTYRGVPTRDIVPESSRYQDPRKILLPSQDTALVSRTEWLSELTNDQPADSSLRPSFQGETPPKFTMLESLEHIANAAPKDTMLLASFQGLYFALPGYGRLPKIETVKISITTPSKPLVTIDLQFATTDLAKSFHARCPTMKKKLIGAIPGARFMKLDDYVNRLDCEASDTYVTVKGQYTQKEFLRAIQLATPFLPKPPDLADLPQPPERPATQDMDMGGAPPTEADMGQAQPDMPATQQEDMAPASDMNRLPAPEELNAAPHTPDMASGRDTSTQAPTTPASEPTSREDMSPPLKETPQPDTQPLDMSSPTPSEQPD